LVSHEPPSLYPLVVLTRPLFFFVLLSFDIDIDINAASDRTPLLVSHPQDPSTPRSIPQIRKSTIHHLTLLIISTILLSISGYLLASTTSNLAILLGLYQSTAGLTILSIATTLPEKLVAFKAGMKKQSGVLIANTVGSCVFLGTLVLGIVYLVRGEAAYENDKMSLRSFSSMGEVGVVEGKAELLDVSVVLASAVILWAIVWYGKFKRWFGVAMLVGYVVYMVSVVMRLK
jgi:Ca2+/Na+ antiporter